jgi:hypothetical protein
MQQGMVLHAHSTAAAALGKQYSTAETQGTANSSFYLCSKLMLKVLTSSDSEKDNAWWCITYLVVNSVPSKSESFREFLSARVR